MLSLQCYYDANLVENRNSSYNMLYLLMISPKITESSNKAFDF